MLFSITSACEPSPSANKEPHLSSHTDHHNRNDPHYNRHSSKRCQKGRKPWKNAHNKPCSSGDWQLFSSTNASSLFPTLSPVFTPSLHGILTYFLRAHRENGETFIRGAMTFSHESGLMSTSSLLWCWHRREYERSPRWNTMWFEIIWAVCW